MVKIMCAKIQEKVDNSTKMWKSSSEETAESILSMIQAHNWQEGHKLPAQRALAESLGVSRPTVREALVILETMGKVDVQPGKGVFLKTRAQEGMSLSVARRPDRSFIAGKETQIYQFRHAIEPAIAALVALNATQAQIDDMAAMLDEMRPAKVPGDVLPGGRIWMFCQRASGWGFPIRKVCGTPWTSTNPCWSICACATRTVRGGPWKNTLLPPLPGRGCESLHGRCCG